ncbi:MAG: hypothetical protein IKY69_05605 [Bacteroidaceae bacterium]|nr:hypothetical protein [Bacteroidaceae bacterium]
MKRYNSYFYKRNKLIVATAIIYAIMFIALVTFIVAQFQTIIANSFLTIAFMLMAPYTLLMLLRALYIIFEKIEVNTEECEIKFRILRKRVPFATIRSIKRVRAGQLRIETSSGLVPFSVDEEEDFIRTMKKAVPSIKID